MTQTGIANLVLSHLGASPVVSINEATPEAEAIRDCWDGVRDALLRSHRWNFAKARAVLTPVVAGVSFQLPTDCLRPLRVNGVEQPGTLDLGGEVEGRQLYVSATSCDLTYIKLVPNPEDWDPLFTVVFAYNLAAAVGPRIANGSQSLSESMLAKGQEQMRYAMMANAVETRAPVARAIEGSRWLQAVWGSPVTRVTPSSPSVTTPAASGGASNVPVITIVMGTDGAWYEKTTMPDGTAFFKPVLPALP